MSMNTSEAVNEIATALSLAQGAIKPASKDSINPHFKSKYADMAAVIEAIREPLAKNGLSVVQDSVTSPEGVSVTTRIFHCSGQWIETGPLTVPVGKFDAHGVGSAGTYAKRYSILGALNVSSLDSDDDGNEASVPHRAKQQSSVPPDGFQDWVDDLTATAETGHIALKQAWTESDKHLRAHLTATHPERWAKLKSRALGIVNDGVDEAPPA
jgi:hypothetical protein